MLTSSPEALRRTDPEDLQELVHELQTYEIELELQNEELRRTHVALVESNEKLANLYDFAPVGYVTTSPKGTVLAANLTLADLLGVARGRLVGASLSPYIVPDDQDTWHRHRMRAQAHGDRASCELRVRGGETEARWVRIESVAEGAGDDLRVRSIISDISRWRKADDERAQMELRLQSAQRLESLGTLAGGIAHDFNNLLMIIVGNTELAQSLLPPESQAHDCMSDTLLASQRAAGLVNLLLAHAGKRRIVPEPVDAGVIVREMAALLEIALSRKTTIVLAIDDDLAAVMADPTQLRQVVLNLVTNAAEAIGDAEGEVAIHVQRRQCDRHLLDLLRPDTTLPEGDYVCIGVRDTGCGMDARVVSLVFDPYFSTKFTGRGLGLAAVHGIVRSHGGAILVDSTPGRGSQFQVFLPAGDGHAPRPDGAREATEGWCGSGLVLVADDDDVVRSVTQRVLQCLGFEPIPARDGAEAVAIFRERSSELVCVVLDNKMPRLDGVDAFRQMRSCDTGVPVVLVSGYGELDVPAQLSREGLAGFIQKPFTLADIRATLRAILPEA